MTIMGRKFYLVCAFAFAQTIFLLVASTQFEWWRTDMIVAVRWIKFTLMITYAWTIGKFLRTWIDFYTEGING